MCVYVLGLKSRVPFHMELATAVEAVVSLPKGQETFPGES